MATLIPQTMQYGALQPWLVQHSEVNLRRPS